MGKKLTMPEKFLKAKTEYEAKKFDSIEAAAKANHMSPASYYNYANKLKASPAALTTSPENMSDAKIKEILGNESNSTVSALQNEIVRLKAKIFDLMMSKV